MQITCIVCPNGCRLTVRKTANGPVVTGHTCPRGEKYGREESTNPVRMVTAVVRTASDDWPCVPVKTTAAIAKKQIPKLLALLYSKRARIPVRSGEPLIRDFDGTGIDVVFTRNVPPALKVKKK